MRILVIQGSLGTPSRTATLADTAGRLLRSWGHEVNVFDLRDHTLPWVDPDLWANPRKQSDPEVDELQRMAQDADAHIWASPVYHNSYSGALKCALDHLSAQQLRDKPVALCGDGGRIGSEQPLEHLRSVARSFHAIATPAVVSTRSQDFALRAGAYEITNDDITDRTSSVCAELVRFGHLMQAEVAAKPQVRDGLEIVPRAGGI